LTVFQELKLGKKHKYIIFNMNKDKTEIVKEKTSTSADYDAFIADLPENECRWAVYDLEFEKEEGGKRNKIIFLSWYVFTPHPPAPFYRMHRPIVIVRRLIIFYRHHHIVVLVPTE
jgi:hypothetical protein